MERRPLCTTRVAGERARRDRPPCRPARRRGARGVEFGAVVGRSFELELLRRLVDDPSVLERLESAVDASLLDESSEHVGRFRFVHSLINQTLYEGLGASRRSTMHHRVALSLEELYEAEPGARVAELALHWRLSGSDAAKAARYSVTAGRRALDSLAPADAAKLFADALELLGAVEDDERCRALIGLGEAQQLTGDPAYRTTLLHAAQIASVPRRRGLGGRSRARQHPRFQQPDRRPGRRARRCDRACARARRRNQRKPASPAPRAAVAGAAVRARPRRAGRRSARRRSRWLATSTTSG